MADLNAVASMLKEVWPTSFETAFSNEIVALQRIESSDEGIRQDYAARYTIIPLRVRRNQGIGARPERGILPLPGGQGYVGTRVELQHQYGVGEITAQALRLADGDPRSFINTLNEDMEGLQDDVIKDYARQIYGHPSGRIATITDSTAGGGDEVEVDRVQYFQLGMRVDLINPATDEVIFEAAEVVGINEEDSLVEIDGATAAPADDYIFVRTGNYYQELAGLDVLVHDTEPIQNLDPAVEPQWASVTLGDSDDPEPYDELQIVRANDEVRRKSGQRVSVMFTGFGVRRGIFQNLVANREYVNTIEFGHGFSALPFTLGSQTIPIVEDPDYPEEVGSTSGSILGVDESKVSIFREPEGWHFADEGGSMFIHDPTRRDAWEFRIRQFSQIGITQRNCHFRINGVLTAEGTAE